MSYEEKNMLKIGEKFPFRRGGAATEKKAGRPEAHSQEAQASEGATEAKEARTGREGPAMPVNLSEIVAVISSRTVHNSSAYEKSALIRGILRRMKATRLLGQQK